MRYPKGLHKGDTIGICAPSTGVYGVFITKFENAVKRLENMGYKVIETASVRTENVLTSASPQVRAQEFMSLYLNDEVKAIIPPWGGEFLMDMMPHLDFEKMREVPPKWVMGFSDLSTLLFTMTLTCDVATVHGPNFLDFGSNPVDESVLNVLGILRSEEQFSQRSLLMHQSDWGNVFEDPYVPYQLTETVQWKALRDESHVSFKGRLIGGCLDTLCKLLGTGYAPVGEYQERYRADGFIWFIESCEMNPTDIYRTLWQLKLNGWFEHCNGIIFGRPDECDLVKGYYTYVHAYKDALTDLDIPVIYDADIGHVPPQLTFVNGALAEIVYEADVDGSTGTVVQWLK